MSALLAGGIPTSTDFAPSVVFAAAYVVALPVAIWRLVSPASRDTVLFRPLAFILIRIVALVLRAVEAKGIISTNLVIVDQVFLSVGSIMLVEPTVALATRLFEARFPYDYSQAQATQTGRRGLRGRAPRRTDTVGRIGLVLRAALLAAVALSIYTAVNISDALTDPNLASKLLTYKKAAGALLLGVVGCSFLIILGGLVAAGLPAKAGLYALVLSGILIVPSVYRLDFTLGDARLDHIYVFYLFLLLPEFIALVLLLAVNVKVLFPAVFPGAAPKAVVEDEPTPQHEKAPTEGTV